MTLDFIMASLCSVSAVRALLVPRAGEASTWAKAVGSTNAGVEQIADTLCPAMSD